MDFGLIKELMKLNIAIYYNSNVSGYKIINHYEDDLGTYINLYEGLYKVLVVRGTEDAKDLNADRAMIINKAPGQAYRSYLFYKNVQNEDIIFTGHSLGGSIANFLNQKFKNKTFCFAPYGGFPKGYSNSICIGSEADYLYTSRIDEIPGSKYLIPYSKSNYPLIINNQIVKTSRSAKVTNFIYSQHFLENWEDITKMIKYK